MQTVAEVNMNGNKKPYDIGIIGYWFATNYGGVSSYYSLYKKLEKAGYSPCFIETPYLATDKEGMDTFPREFFDNINANVSRCYTIDELDKLNELADTFVLGSDQVLTSFAIRVFGKLFLMEFGKCGARKIAISASCGGDNLNSDDNLVVYAKRRLKDFTAVSVREYTAVDIVKKKFDINSNVVIDPVFFTTKEEYEELSKGTSIHEEEPYLLAYVLDPSSDKKEAIQKIAKEQKLKIKIALDGRKFTHNDNFNKMEMPNETLPELDYREWLYYFTHASYVFTDSFHGACMSIIMNKPLIMYANHMRGYPRFLTLADMFDLHNRLVDNSQMISSELINKKIDYDKVNEIKMKECMQAEEWLKHALETSINRKAARHIPPLEYDENNNVLKMCVGCGACVNKCPVNAIKLAADEFGYYRAKIDEEKCINCGLCEKVCPAIDVPEKNNSDVPLCYSFVAKERELLSKSSSGGVFGLLAKEVFGMKGHVVGAAWRDNFTVGHLLVSKEEDLNKLQKSKYLQSYIGDVLKDVKEKLDNGEFVLYSGCPCQIAGMKKFLGKEYDNLLLVDILCANAPSSMFFKKYLDDSFPEGILDYEFRYKINSKNVDCVTLKVTTNEQKEIIRTGSLQDDYQQVFHDHTMCAQHCERCKYNSIPRYGDLTIGDFWGYSKFDNTVDTSKGVSVVLCNNEKGKRFFELIPDEKIAVKKEVPIEWLGSNGYALKGKNYSSPYRNRFYDAIKKSSFSEAIEYAYLEKNTSVYPYAVKNVPLQYNSAQLRFRFDASMWEEHYINGTTVLTTKHEKPPLGYYCSMPMMHTLKKGKKYRLIMRFKINTTSNILNLHIKEDSTKRTQIIYTHKVSKKDAFEWCKIIVDFVPDSDVYSEFMVGAGHITGRERFIAIDYIDIREL